MRKYPSAAEPDKETCEQFELQNKADSGKHLIAAVLGHMLDEPGAKL